ncbi:hypothetical protein JCM10449v2_006939 [Rhodotorula kratochvilovae]
MALPRSLPLNVQALICSFLPRAVRPAFPRFPLRARFSSTAVLASVDPLFPPASAPFTPNQHLAHAQAVFEEPSDEYSNVPLSVLDHPAVPRSPDDSLLALLDARNFADARKLLHELRTSGQPLPPRYLFCKHARRAATAVANGGDLLTRNEHGERDWLEWWKLAPGVADPVHPDVVSLRGADNAMARHAEKLLRLLRASPALHGDGSMDEGFALLEEFALVLCRQGQVRIVAQEVFPYLTAYAPPETGERVFAAALHALKRDRADFLAQGAYLAHRRRSARHRTRFLRAPQLDALVARVVARRTATMRTWFLNRQQAALDALVSARESAVLAHANLGRLDTAVSMLVATQSGPYATERVKLGRETYLRVLGLLADRNEFALFERVYASLRAGSRRLTRTRTAWMRERTPYLIRGSAFDPLDVAPSAREAFLAWRYQNSASAIEEGPELDALLEEDARAATGEHGVSLAEEVYRNRSVKLVRLVEHDDESGSRFSDSARVLAQWLVEANEPGGRLPPSATPSANALAVWILHARKLAQHNPHCGEVLVALSVEAQAQASTRGAWAAGTVLAEIKSGHYAAALHAFKAHFDVAALPPRLRTALWDATHDRRPRVEREARRGVPPSAYHLALVVQALVMWYGARVGTARTSQGAEKARQVIREVYDELLAASGSSSSTGLAVIPSHVRSRRAGETSALEGVDKPSPLDPHSFTPFLLLHLRARSPLAAARVLADMHARHIAPQAPHFAIMLNAFARGSSDGSVPLSDLLFLLALFERRPHPAELPSPGLRALIPALPLPEEGVTLGVHVYTGVLSGLRRRGERGAALDVLKGLADSRGEELRAWARGDERFRQEVVLLGKASGVSAAAAL